MNGVSVKIPPLGFWYEVHKWLNFLLEWVASHISPTEFDPKNVAATVYTKSLFFSLSGWKFIRVIYKMSRDTAVYDASCHIYNTRKTVWGGVSDPWLQILEAICIRFVRSHPLSHCACGGQDGADRSDFFWDVFRLDPNAPLQKSGS